jgi:FO synthase
LREAVLMHAVGRLALSPALTNIQTSWCKMGPHAAKLALRAGANDLGGTLMSESISRAAGASYGQEMPPPAMHALVAELDREQGCDPADRRYAWHRTTLYAPAPEERVRAALR